MNYCYPSLRRQSLDAGNHWYSIRSELSITVHLMVHQQGSNRVRLTLFVKQFCSSLIDEVGQWHRLLFHNERRNDDCDVHALVIALHCMTNIASFALFYFNCDGDEFLKDGLISKHPYLTHVSWQQASAFDLVPSTSTALSRTFACLKHRQVVELVREVVEDVSD